MSADSAREEILFGRSPTLKVFISSKMRGGSLASERVAAAEAVDSHPDAEAWLWERSANAGPYSSLEVCRGHAATCDVLFLIVSDELTAPTEIEWRAANAAGAVCAILLKEDVERSPHLDAFLVAERDRCVFVPFGSLSELRTRVHDTLRQNHADAVRRNAMRRKVTASVPYPLATELIELGIAKAEQCLWAGSAEDALSVLSALEALSESTDERIEELELVSGLVHSVLGERSRAVQAFERILQDGRSSSEAITLAHQNLGLEALKSRDVALAKKHMLLAFQRYKDGQNWFGVTQMLLNLGTLVAEKKKLSEALEFADLAENLLDVALVALPDQRAGVWALRGLVAAYRSDPKMALKCYRKSHDLASKSGNRDGEVVSMQNIGSAYVDLGRPMLGLRWYRKALAVAESAGNLWRMEEIHHSVALASHRMGNVAMAMREFESARALAARMGDGWKVATLTADIGALCAVASDGRANEELERAEADLRGFGDHEWLHRVQCNRAVLARENGDAPAAIAILSDSLSCAAGDDARSQHTWEMLGSILAEDLRDLPQALDAYRTAARQSGRTGSELAWALAEYGVNLLEARHLRGALELIDEALEFVGDPETEFHIRNERAVVLSDLGDIDEAERLFAQGIEVARRLSNRALELQALENLGELQRRAGKLDASIATLEHAFNLANELDDAEDQRSVLGLLALAELASEKFDDAKRYALELRDGAAHVEDRANESLAFSVLGCVAYHRGEFAEAVALHRRAANKRKSDPRHLAESLADIVDVLAAKGDWRATMRAAQRLVDHAQAEHLEAIAWETLLHTGRRFLEHGDLSRAAEFVFPGLVLALAVERISPATTAEGEMEIGALYEAVLTVAFHILWSNQDGLGLWSLVLDRFDRHDVEIRAGLEHLIAVASDRARELHEAEPVNVVAS